nr:reverse transcriptase domain-containing protein [Tanacetum cinerariifolium]
MGVAENMLVQVGKFVFPVYFVILQMEEDDRVPLILGRPFLHTAAAIIRVKNKELNLGIREDRETFLIDKALQHSHLNDDTCFRMDVIDEDEVKDDFKELPPKDVIRIKTSIQDPPTNLEMKPLPKHLEYAFLEENSLLLVVISALLEQNKKERLILVLKNHKEAFAWKTSDIPGISPSFCKHKINFEDDVKPVIQRRRRLNPNMKKVIKKEIIKLMDAGIIYAIEDSPWVSPVHYVPKKGGMTVVTNEDNELVPTRTVIGLCVCIDYQLKEEEINDEFPDEFLMSISTDEKESMWFADFANYLVGGILRKGLTCTQRCKLFLELKHYFGDEPYLFKACPDGMIERCVRGSKLKKLSMNVIMDPLGDIVDLRLPQRKFLMLDFIGQPFSKKHRLSYKTVTPANVLVAFHKETRCL